jgi:flavorubredoxin
MAAVDEIADDIFRINLVLPGRQVTFSFFLVRADEPTLIETSYGMFFDETRDAVARLVDPTTIRHILVPHFEGDECGGMNHFLRLARSPRAGRCWTSPSESRERWTTAS